MLRYRHAHQCPGLRRIGLPTLGLIASLLGAQTLHAQTLYRWTEPDGSITYATTPPAGGVAYEAVGRKAPTHRPTEAVGKVDRTQTPTAIPESSQAKPDPTWSTPATSLPASRANDSGQQPTRSGASNGNAGGTRSQPQGPAAALPSSASTLRFEAAQNRSNARKSQHCAELGKRITSLERRLQADISDEDMDGTVVNMARYQRSLDRYCR